MSGEPKENAQAERINSTMKNELFRGMVFNSIDEVKDAVDVAVDIYNNERPYMSIDMMTPREAADGCTGEIAKRWKSYRLIAIKNRQVVKYHGKKFTFVVLSGVSFRATPYSQPKSGKDITLLNLILYRIVFVKLNIFIQMKKSFFNFGGTAVLAVACMLVSCNEKVKKEAVAGVTLDPTSVTLALIGDTETLKAIIDPANATNKDLTWSTNDAKVATVSEGVVTATGEGACVITVKTVDGDKTATCDVTVPEQPPFLTLDETELILNINATQRLFATVLPENFENKTVRWSSSDDKVATVSANGTVTGKGYGECIITAKMVEGEKTATCNVIVPSRVTGVVLDKNFTIIYGLNNSKLTATLYPATATIKGLIWSSDKPEIVDVIEDGTIISLSYGTANITVETIDGGFTSTCEVLVLDPQKYKIIKWTGDQNTSDPATNQWNDISILPKFQGLLPGKRVIVNQNVWLRNPEYKQTMYYSSLGDWYVVANCNTGWGGVQCYPGTGWEMDYPEIPVKNIKSMVSSWDVDFSKDPTKVAAWACYDNWYNGWDIEVMIVVAMTVPNNYHSSNNLATAEFGGQTWHLQRHSPKFYQWKCGTNDNNLVSMFNGELDLNPFVEYLEDHGYIKAGSTWTMGGFGYEICDTRGVDQIFSLKDLTVKIERK